MELPTPTPQPRPIFSWSLVATAVVTAIASTALDYDYASPEAQLRAAQLWTSFEPVEPHVTIPLGPQSDPDAPAFDTRPGRIVP